MKDEKWIKVWTFFLPFFLFFKGYLCECMESNCNSKNSKWIITGINPMSIWVQQHGSLPSFAKYQIKNIIMIPDVTFFTFLPYYFPFQYQLQCCTEPKIWSQDKGFNLDLFIILLLLMLFLMTAWHYSMKLHHDKW